MGLLYDTSTVHPLDRYDYYRTGAASEAAPVTIRGHSPDHLRAAMSVIRIGEFELAEFSWAADAEVTALRTRRLIRVGDPECYRIWLSISGGEWGEQADNRVRFRTGDIVLYDMSRPLRAIHPTGRISRRRVLLTFPRAVVPITPALVRPILGTILPRRMPGRSLVAQFLIELADLAMTQQVTDPALVDALHECTIGLIRQRLGQSSGITPQTRWRLHLARIHAIIRRNLGDPTLDTEQIAKAAHISTRYLYKIFQNAELTPMQLLKRMRLEECHRSLQDPASTTKSIKDLISQHGYLRPDQFARDFRQLFGVSPTQLRPASGRTTSPGPLVFPVAGDNLS
jgi:AraC-like DNA-binding protein